MLRQTRQPMSVFLIPVNQSKQLWHHSTPEYIWHHLPKITKTCQTGYTNHDIIHLKIAHDVIDKPVKLDILNKIPPQVNEIPAHFIHEMKTIAYDFSDVNLFPPTLMRFPLQKNGLTGARYTTCVDKPWLNFKSAFLKVADRHAPLIQKRVRGVDNCPWMTGQIKKDIRQRDYFLKKARKSSRDED